MNKARALRIVEELKGKKVGSWIILDYINNGKSALVAKATLKKEIVALKIFDPDLVEHFGRDIQLSRIEREKILIGKNHPNLIKILGGGACPRTNYLFVVMEYLPDNNLYEVLKKFPRDKIFPIICQVAMAAKFLEDNGLAHRDIKPENIAISADFSRATLLDLGVLRPVGLSQLEGYDYQKAFLATLQYSPPELLDRIEEDNIEGWRAVTFYQLGAVLHDLIMRKPIFNEFKPYAKLIDAVRKLTPSLNSNDVEGKLILIAQSCLLKSFRDRLSLVRWDTFSEQPSTKKPLDEVKQRILKKQALFKCQSKEVDDSDIKRYLYEKYLNFQNLVDSIKDMIRTICINDKEFYPPIEIDSSIESKSTAASIMVCFHHSSRHGIYKTVTLSVLFSVSGDNDEIVKINYVALDWKNCVDQPTLDNYVIETLFTGPFEPNAIKERLNLLLLALIDKVLEVYPSKQVNAIENLLEPLQIILNIEKEVS